VATGPPESVDCGFESSVGSLAVLRGKILTEGGGFIASDVFAGRPSTSAPSRSTGPTPGPVAPERRPPRQSVHGFLFMASMDRLCSLRLHAAVIMALAWPSSMADIPRTHHIRMPC
jgi:hypothetical protein